ncbi:MAG TPA: hypothetical protein PKA37_11595 [Planctomycetota bacterium]|jgi:hypothetical protein|nr:hypothetical protein [Planctomycetota bacterium]
MSHDVFSLNNYLIRRRVVKIVGASFDVFHNDEAVAFTSQKAFKLKEDIAVFRDETMTTALLRIGARSIVDFSAAYDIWDASTEARIGCAQRRGMKSLIRDAWDLLDADERVLGQVAEDSPWKALVRRALTNLIPQSFHLKVTGQEDVIFKQRWNPFVYRLEVSIPETCTLDRRLILAMAILIAAIEGRQA